MLRDCDIITFFQKIGHNLFSATDARLGAT